MVWGCFSCDCEGPLVQIEGIMDAKYYTDLMKNHILPHVKAKMGVSSRIMTLNTLRRLRKISSHLNKPVFWTGLAKVQT